MKLTEYQIRLLNELKDLNRVSGPVHSRLIADFVGIAERTARDWLVKLEQMGMVMRPYGKRSGWKAM